MFLKLPCNYFAFFLLFFVLLLTSCQNKTKALLVKKWDCVQVENLAPVNKNFLSKEDSLVTAKLETALQQLSWQFNDDNSYQCSTAGIVTAQGTYTITDDSQFLILTSTKGNSNSYTIKSLTKQELVLNGQTTNLPVVLHFKPH
jgi:hypothetical protein